MIIGVIRNWWLRSSRVCLSKPYPASNTTTLWTETCKILILRKLSSKFLWMVRSWRFTTWKYTRTLSMFWKLIRLRWNDWFRMLQTVRNGMSQSEPKYRQLPADLTRSSISCMAASAQDSGHWGSTLIVSRTSNSKIYHSKAGNVFPSKWLIVKSTL